MKTFAILTRASLAMGMTLLLSSGIALAQTTVWDVPDPFVGEGGESGNLPSVLVDASTLTLPGITDGGRDMIGEFSFTGNTQFGNINRAFTFGTDTEAGEIDPALIGTNFRMSVDYYIPSGGNLQGDDLFYLQLNTNGNNTLDGNSAGFFTNTPENADQWNTLTMDYTVLDNSPTTDIQAFLIVVDGGFSGFPDGDGSPVIYLDNLQLIGNAPIEPDLLGDFDLDGDVDLDDLDQYNGNLGMAATGALEALDLDENGTVELADFQQHYETLVETSNGGKGTAAGDVNLDGVVNVLGDAFALVGNLNNAATSWSQGDLNADGTVNVLGDAFLLVGNLGADNGGGGEAPSTSAVPEPGSLSLLALASLSVVARRRR